MKNLQLLTSYTKNSIANTYSYDYNGIRQSKTSGSLTTMYLYSGNKLISEQNANYTIWYLYDQNGLIGFEISGTVNGTYYYVRNQQGDVVMVVSATGAVMASYSYNAWGEYAITSNVGDIANINPIRYRGYYYDKETGLYSIGPRYYDPEVGRWINPDVLAENGNLYAYCVNDPVNNIDPSGYLSQKWKTRLIKIGIGVALATAAIAITVATGGAALPVIASIATATLVGAGVGAGVAAMSHRVNTGSWDGAGQAALEGAIDGAVDGFLTGSALAFVGASVNAIKSAGQMASTVAKTGQQHHVISNKINNSLKNHSTLSGKFNRGDYLVQAIDKSAHSGYQTWHRAYDKEVVRWLADNPVATTTAFKGMMNGIYKTAEMVSRFGKYIPFG